MARIYRPPSRTEIGLSLLADVPDDPASLASKPKIIDGDLNLPGLTWSTITEPQTKHYLSRA